MSAITVTRVHWKCDRCDAKDVSSQLQMPRDWSIITIKTDSNKEKKIDLCDNCSDVIKKLIDDVCALEKI